jgi:DNA-binding NarL/FixJ family response regulator
LSDQVRNSEPRTQNSTPHQQPAKIRVLLVDDHAMVRQGLKTVLDSYADIEVVGEAWDGEEAVKAVERLHPAVVLMDINMPKMNGIEATAHIKARHPEIIVIGLSVQAGGANEEAMKKAGAAMLLTKEAAVDELYQAIREALGRKQS